MGLTGGRRLRQSVRPCEKAGEYSFAGYGDTLHAIYRGMRSGAGVRVLDLGFGTGVLTEELYADGREICGVDFSRRMVAIAQDKVPRAGVVRNEPMPPAYPPAVERKGAS